MDVKQVKELADTRRPCLARVQISGGAEAHILCKRILAVSWVVPESGGGFWGAECISDRTNTKYRVRVEDIKEV